MWQAVTEMAVRKRSRLLILLSLLSIVLFCWYNYTSSGMNSSHSSSVDSPKDIHGPDTNIGSNQKLDDVKPVPNYVRKVKGVDSDAVKDENDVLRHSMAVKVPQKYDGGIPDRDDSEQRNIRDDQKEDRYPLNIHDKVARFTASPQRNIEDAHQNTHNEQSLPKHVNLRKDGVMDRRHPKTKCRDVLCTEYLNETDMYAFNVCRIRAKSKMSSETAEKKNVKKLAKTYDVDIDSDPLTSGGCKFMNGTGREVYGLISFPGSGNTWVRGLLQAATGICTGAVYCDGILRATGFDGEGVQSSSVLCVKEHTYTPKWTLVRKWRYFDKKDRPYYDKVVLLVRNPFHALVSEWNRELGTKSNNRSTSHTTSFGPEYFGEFHPWNVYLKGRIKQWIQGFDWLTLSPRASDIIMVRYEDLRTDLVSEVKRMTDFLGVDVSETVISERLNAAQFSFHRTNRKLFNHFTSEQRQAVVAAIVTVANRLHTKFSKTFRIEEYIK